MSALTSAAIIAVERLSDKYRTVYSFCLLTGIRRNRGASSRTTGTITGRRRLFLIQPNLPSQSLMSSLLAFHGPVGFIAHFLSISSYRSPARTYFHRFLRLPTRSQRRNSHPNAKGSLPFQPLPALTSVPCMVSRRNYRWPSFSRSRSLNYSVHRIEVARGVLLWDPHRCGKTLLANE